MNRILAITIIVLLIVAAVLAWTTDYHHGNAVKYKSQRGTTVHSLKLANATITDMQTRQRDVAALNAKYTKELADAKAANDALLLVVGCVSKDVVQCQPVPHPPAPVAWAMLPPPNSLQILDRTFLIFGPESESSATRKN